MKGPGLDVDLYGDLMLKARQTVIHRYGYGVTDEATMGTEHLPLKWSVMDVLERWR